MSLQIEFEIKDKATSEVKKLKEQLNQLQPKIKETDKAFLGMNKALLLSTASFVSIGSAMAKVVKDGFAFNAQIEQSIAGLTSLSVATQDKAIPVMERYSVAGKEATKTMKELQKINAQTPHTLDQTNKIYKAMYVSMKSAGATTKDMIELTRSLSIASGSAGIEFNSLLAGVDGLASGTVMANSDLGRFLSSLGLTNKTLKESEDVVGLVVDKLKDFKSADTMAVSVSNLENAWSQLTGELTKSAFESTKKDLNIVSELLQETTHWVHELGIQFTSAFDMKKSSNIDDLKIKLKDINEQIDSIKSKQSSWYSGMLNQGDIYNDLQARLLEKKDLELKIIELTNQKEKDSIVEIAEFKKRKAKLAETKRLKALKDNAKQYLKELDNTTQIEFDRISDKWDAEEKAEEEVQKNKIAFEKWYTDYLMNQTDIRSNYISDTFNKVLKDSLSDVFTPSNYNFNDLGKSFGDAMSKNLASATQKSVTSLTQLFTNSDGAGVSGLFSTAVGGLAGMGVGSGINYLSDRSARKKAEAEAKATERMNDFTEAIEESTHSLHNQAMEQKIMIDSLKREEEIAISSIDIMDLSKLGQDVVYINKLTDEYIKLEKEYANSKGDEVFSLGQEIELLSEIDPLKKQNIERERELAQAYSETARQLLLVKFSVEDNNKRLEKQSELQDEYNRLGLTTHELQKLDLELLDEESKKIQNKIWVKELELRIESERLGLEEQLLRVGADKYELRELEIKQLNSSNYAIQREIWAKEDLIEAEQLAVQVAIDLANKLKDAQSTIESDISKQYNDEISRLNSLANAFDNMSSSIDSTIRSLIGGSSGFQDQGTLISSFWEKQKEADLLLGKSDNLSIAEQSRLSDLIGDINSLSGSIQGSTFGSNTSITGNLLSELGFINKDVLSSKGMISTESLIADLIDTSIDYLGKDSDIVKWLTTIDTSLNGIDFATYKEQQKLKEATDYVSGVTVSNGVINEGIKEEISKVEDNTDTIKSDNALAWGIDQNMNANIGKIMQNLALGGSGVGDLIQAIKWSNSTIANKTLDIGSTIDTIDKRIVVSNIFTSAMRSMMREQNNRWGYQSNGTDSLPQYNVGTTNLSGDQVIQAHNGEMIIPRDFSDGLRDGDVTMGSQKDVVAKLNATNKRLDLMEQVLMALLNKTTSVDDTLTRIENNGLIAIQGA